MPQDLGTCTCSKYPDQPCNGPITQEDLLCDFCRTSVCCAVTPIDDERKEFGGHVLIEGLGQVFQPTSADTEFVRIKLDEIYKRLK